MHFAACACLRPSMIDGAKHAWAILALLTKRIRQTWPDVKIIFRGDSGFCRWKMLRWCESHEVEYIVGIGGNARLKRFGSALIEHTSMGANTRFILTSLEGAGQQLYDEVYCARGDMENRIKEQQLDLYADRTSCHNWWPSQLRLIPSSLAYILFDHIRRTALKNTRLANATSATIRNKLIRIGAVIVRNTRRIRFHLSTSYPRKELFAVVAARLQ
jgi:hypothetical protein